MHILQTRQPLFQVLELTNLEWKEWKEWKEEGIIITVD